jgi:hypothetical protein
MVVVAFAALGPAAGADAASSPERLAKQIAAGTDAAGAAAATRQALRRAGMTAVDRGIAGRLALGARLRASRGSVDLNELAQLLRHAGVAPRGGGSPQRLRRLLADLARGARRHPRSRYAFGPRFIAAMVQRQRPRIDLTRRYAPSALRLSLLEVQVLAATLGATGRRGSVRAAQHPVPAPCSELKKQLSQTLPGAGDAVEKVTKSAPKWFRKALEHFTGTTYEDAFSKPFRLVVKAFGWAYQAASVASFYTAAAPELSVEPTEVRKPEPGGAGRQVEIAVHVGMSESEVREWQGADGGSSALFDCARAFGIKLPKSNPEVLRDIADWRIRLTVRGPGGMLQLARGEYPTEDGRATPLRYPLTLRGLYEGDLRVRYDVLEETALEHAGPERVARMTVVAEVQSRDGLNLLDFLSGTGAVPGIVLNWLKAALPPTATAPVDVGYGHEGHCGEVRVDAGLAAAGFRAGRYSGKGRTRGEPDPEQERHGAECEEFSIAFTADAEVIKDFAIKSLDWVCDARQEGDKRDAPDLIELPYSPRPDGFQRRALDHRRGEFGLTQRWTASTPLGPVDATFELTGHVRDGTARGTVLYAEAYRGLSGFPAKCSTGAVGWKATRRT